MQISIQSVEITYNKTPYRFIVKKVFNTSKNELIFHCWAPEDNMHTKSLIEDQVMIFEWDDGVSDLKPVNEHPVSHYLKNAIVENFSLERV